MKILKKTTFNYRILNKHFQKNFKILKIKLNNILQKFHKFYDFDQKLHNTSIKLLQINKKKLNKLVNQNIKFKIFRNNF